MPQDSIFDDDQRWTGYRFEMREVVGVDGTSWDVALLRRDDRQEWRTCWVGSWRGVMLDYANTMAADTLQAFLYGERRDLARAAAGVHTLARRHAAMHDRGRF